MRKAHHFLAEVTAFLISLGYVASGWSFAQDSAHRRLQVNSMNADIARTIDWLPEDTETIIVDRQPHALGAAGDMTPIDGISRFSFIYSLHNRTLGPVYSPFAKTKIALVIEGSRKFRAPKDILGNRMIALRHLRPSGSP